MINQNTGIDPKTGIPAQTDTNTPAPAAKTPPKPADTDAIAKFSQRFLGDPEAAPAKKPKLQPAQTQPQIPEPELSQTEESAAKPKRRPAPRAATPTVEKIVEAVSEGVSRAISKQTPTEPPPVETEQPPSLPPEESRKIEIFQQMERQYPDKYKGLADKYRTSLQKAIEYAAQWEKDNPGQEFNEDDVEHEMFFEENGVDYEDEHYVDALTEVKLSERMPKMGEVQQKITSIERQEALRQKMPIIDRHQALTARSFFTQFGNGFENVINEDGSVNKEALDALKESDPVLHEIAVTHAASVVEPVAAEIYKLFDGLTDLDVRNPQHKWINDFAVQAENMMLKQPERKRLNENGLPFVTAEQYNRLSFAERQRCWTFGAVELSALAADALASDLSEYVQKENKKYESWAKARKLMPKEDEESEGRADMDDEPANSRGKPVSPEAGAEPRLARGQAAGRLEGDSPRKTFFNRLVG